MCVVSAVGDHYSRKLPMDYPWVMPSPFTPPPQPYTRPNTSPFQFPAPVPGPSQEDFDALKKSVEDIKEILAVAKAYDEATGQPDCEVDEKTRILWKFADKAGVDLTDVLGPRPADPEDA